MTLRLIQIILISTLLYSCGWLDKELPPNIKTTACFKNSASLIQASSRLPMVKIQNGDLIVFDFIRDKGDNQDIVNGDTITTADTDFYERVTFAVNSNVESFFFSDDSLNVLNGFYEFHGGESPLANTDFKIRKGFIQGHKQKDSWLIEAEVAVVDKQKRDSIIQEIKFKETFKNCD